VTAPNITLADVIVEEVSLRLVTERIARATLCCRARSSEFGRIDPRSAVKEMTRGGPIETAISYARVGELARAAHGLLIEHCSVSQQRGMEPPRDEGRVLQRLMERIVHDHLPRSSGGGGQLGARTAFDLYESPQRRRDAKALARDRQRCLLEEALYLLAEAGLAPRLVGRRLGLTPSVLRRLVLCREPDPALLQRQPRRG
jgi:transposase